MTYNSSEYLRGESLEAGSFWIRFGNRLHCYSGAKKDLAGIMGKLVTTSPLFISRMFSVSANVKETIMSENVSHTCDSSLLVRESSEHGDSKAIVNLFLKHRSEMLQYAFRILGDYDDAEDAVQDAALNVLQKGSTFDPARSFGPWFRQIVHNCCIDCWRRKRKADAAVPLDDATLSTADRPDQIVEIAELKEKLRAVITTLPEGTRATIDLHYFEQRSTAEISEMFSIRPATVYVRLHRGRKLIKASFPCLLAHEI